MVTESTTTTFSLWRGPSTPPPRSRIRPEAADNYAKGRGTLQKVVFEQQSTSASSSSSAASPKQRPSPRCPSTASKVNYELSVHGNVGNVLKGTAVPRPSTAPPRIKTEAVEIATLSQGTRMRSVLHEPNQNGGGSGGGNGGDSGATGAPTPRVKPEGEPIATMSKGKRMSTLIHEYGQHVASPRQPRVRREGQENASTAQGGRMHSLMHKYGTMPAPSSRAVPRVRPDGTAGATLGKPSKRDNVINLHGTPRRASPRVRPEAETYADLDKGKRMATLLHPSSTLPSFARPSPRVKPEASRSADLGKGPRMAQLLYEGNSMTESPRPASRTVGEQAKKNLWHGVIGSVGNCLKQSGRKTCLFLPRQPSRRLSRPCVV